MDIWKTKDKDEASQLKSGTWDTISNEPLKEKIKFEFSKPESVLMQCDSPREIPWETGVFYVFDVLHDGKEKCITTSAWTLLKGLKSFDPLNGKNLVISKVMDGGKQVYKVEEKDMEEAVVASPHDLM
tara:strand:+ start:103 stop:486 length:384 start_codon:yes stop_codon:yes gene_type:complete